MAEKMIQVMVRTYVTARMIACAMKIPERLVRETYHLPKPPRGRSDQEPYLNVTRYPEIQAAFEAQAIERARRKAVRAFLEGR